MFKIKKILTVVLIWAMTIVVNTYGWASVFDQRATKENNAIPVGFKGNKPVDRWVAIDPGIKRDEKRASEQRDSSKKVVDVREFDKKVNEFKLALGKRPDEIVLRDGTRVKVPPDVGFSVAYEYFYKSVKQLDGKTLLVPVATKRLIINIHRVSDSGVIYMRRGDRSVFYDMGWKTGKEWMKQIEFEFNQDGTLRSEKLSEKIIRSNEYDHGVLKKKY